MSDKQACLELENRTGQFISTGEDLANFWNTIIGEPENLGSSVGIVLDVQQLNTITGPRFCGQLALISLETIKGLRIYARHRLPSLLDPIPWIFGF
jgi:hypothetical protein